MATEKMMKEAEQMLLDEMAEYVKENNVTYNEISPEQLQLKQQPAQLPTFLSIPEISSSNSCNESFETASSELKEEEEGKKEPFAKRVRFADEHGLPLSTIRLIRPSYIKDGRLIILLLSPSKRIFEFIQVQYPIDGATTTQVLVDQLQCIATNPLFKYTEFVGLSRIKGSNGGNGSNSTSAATSPEDDEDSTCSTSIPYLLDPLKVLEDFGFHTCELVLAVPQGHTPSDLITVAFPLLLNGTIKKGLSKGRRSGRGLKLLKSGNDWYKDRQLKKASSCCPVDDLCEEKYSYKEWDVVGDLVDNVIIFKIELEDYATTWEEIRDLGNCYRGEEDSDWGKNSRGGEETSRIFYGQPSLRLCYDDQESEHSVVDDTNSRSLGLHSKQGAPSPHSLVASGMRSISDPVLWELVGGKEGAEIVIMSLYYISIAAAFGLLSIGEN
jgi:hypothetical protein